MSRPPPPPEQIPRQATPTPDEPAIADDLGMSPAAFAVVSERYLRRDATGRICESPGQMMDRVSTAVAAAEEVYRPGTASQWAERFAAVLRRREFLPNSPTLLNAGLESGVLSGCFVLPIADSLESIFTTLRTTALLQQAGAGTGFSFSHVRPRADRMEPTTGTAGGPVPFIELYDTAARVIRLGGRRRGAMMATLHVGHPDIEEFVALAAEPGRLSSTTLSVGLTDAFLDAAVAGRDHPLIDPRTGRVVRTVSARGLLDTVATAARQTGEPGILFLDTIARFDPVPELGPIETTNPCGEVPLAAYESCNLGSIDLSRCVRGDRFDERRLDELVPLAVRFLDDVIDIADYPVTELARAARATRKIGLGVMGLAETLAAVGIPYDSDAAERFAERVMARITARARAASADLAAERGPFPLFSRSRWARRSRPLRNAQLTAVAPTGTIALLAGTSASIEPLFALAYTRHLLGRDFVQVDPLFRRVLEERGIWSDAVAAELMAAGTPDIAAVPGELRRRFVTAERISPRWQLRIQAAVQRHIDAAVAKTVSLPGSATVDDVRELTMTAWRAGIKGFTVYRTGSRPDEVLRRRGPGRQGTHVHGTYTGGAPATAGLPTAAPFHD